MPRVENTGPEVSAWCAETGEGSSVYDFCVECYKVVRQDPFAFRLATHHAGEPIGSGGLRGDVWHPSYEDVDYYCDACGVRLTSEDDNA